MLAIGMVKVPHVEATGRHFHEQIPRVFEQRPELGRRGGAAGQPTAGADDGDGFWSGRRRGHDGFVVIRKSLKTRERKGRGKEEEIREERRGGGGAEEKVKR